MSYWQFEFPEVKEISPLSQETLFFSIYFNYHLIKTGIYYSKHWRELVDYIFM